MTDWEKTATVRKGQIDYLRRRCTELQEQRDAACAGRQNEQQMLRNAVDTIQQQNATIELMKTVLYMIAVRPCEALPIIGRTCDERGPHAAKCGVCSARAVLPPKSEATP
jgi:predicted oxidoreductase